MVLVVDVKSNVILAKFEAWDADCIDDAVQWTKDNERKIVKEEVTTMGDMVIWVE